MSKQYKIKLLNTKFMIKCLAINPLSIVFMVMLFTNTALSAVKVTIKPNCIPMQANSNQQFQASVTGTPQQEVTWHVNGVKGGAPSIGTITNTGLYTAPANVDEVTNAEINAVAVVDQTVLSSSNVCVQRYERQGNTYYVSNNGDDGSNPGTQTAPWKTIQYAINRVNAGDTILVRNGVYNETVTITRSGSANNGFITLMSAPGENAIIDGTGLVQQSYGQRGLITLNDVSYVRVKNLEIRNYHSSTEFIVIGILVSGIGDRIELQNNHIHDIKATNLPENGHAGALGIAVYGLSSGSLTNIIVDGNKLNQLETGRGESLTIGGNVDKWQVTRNYVHNNNFIGIDALGYYNANAVDPEMDRPRNGWIANNAVYDLSSVNNPQATIIGAAAVGIYVDGGRDITIERNHVDGAEGGIWLLSEKTGKKTSNIIVRNNLARFNLNAGILVGGYGEADSGGAENVKIVNNTLYLNNTKITQEINSGEFQIAYNANNILFKNNILFAGAKGYAIAKFSPESSSSVSIGNNLYYTSSGSDYTRWFWANKNYFNDGSSPNNFAAFQAVSGDNNSIIDNPQFVRTSSPVDLSLRTNSPAIDTGLYNSLLGFSTVGKFDYVGNPRVESGTIDRGAYEQ